MVQVANVFPQFASISASMSYTRTLGGWAWVDVTYNGQLGNQMKLTKISIYGMWRLNGQVISGQFSADSDFNSKLTGTVILSNIMNLSPPVPGATLFLAIMIRGEDPNNPANYDLSDYWWDTGVPYVSAPDQVTADVPVNAPVLVGDLIDASCSADYNGTSTRDMKRNFLVLMKQ